MNLYTVDAVLFFVACYLVYKFFSREIHSSTTPLRGPPSSGALRQIRAVPDEAVVYERWAKEYGPAYSVPHVFGTTKIMLHDPKAASHFYMREGNGFYSKTTMARSFIDTLFGRGIIWAEGDNHRRQRKSLTPAFSNAAIRNLTHVFFDSAYKMNHKWNAILENSVDGSEVIDVQKWMNRISLDSIGIAGFSYDFHALEGAPFVLDTFNVGGSPLFIILLLLGQQFPIFGKLPNPRRSMMKELRKDLSKVADELLRKGKEGGLAENKSIIGLLLQSEDERSNFHMSQDEIIAQMNVLLLAGYETTSISLTWTLIELSRKPEVQARLREELMSQCGSSDPTYDHLHSGLPYLDAVIHEILRTHPALPETARVAVEDDIIPLSTPVTTKSGDTISSLFIAKGQLTAVNIRTMNRSEEIWGPDAHEFVPERWLDEERMKTIETQGHRHLLTFMDGPRTCLGKQFAITELKAVLSVLVRTWKFEFDGGKELEIAKFSSILLRPRQADEKGPVVRLRVRPV